MDSHDHLHDFVILFLVCSNIEWPKTYWQPNNALAALLKAMSTSSFYLTAFDAVKKHRVFMKKLSYIRCELFFFMYLSKGMCRGSTVFLLGGALLARAKVWWCICLFHSHLIIWCTVPDCHVCFVAFCSKCSQLHRFLY